MNYYFDIWFESTTIYSSKGKIEPKEFSKTSEDAENYLNDIPEDIRNKCKVTLFPVGK